jgi:hypothetical protein
MDGSRKVLRRHRLVNKHLDKGGKRMIAFLALIYFTFIVPLLE